MRNIPERVKKILADRTKAAQKFMALDSELVQWMEDQGINVADWSCTLGDHIHGGCESIVNPKASEEAILRFLENW